MARGCRLWWSSGHARQGAASAKAYEGCKLCATVLRVVPCLHGVEHAPSQEHSKPSQSLKSRKTVLLSGLSRKPLS